ncbi:hypothetical protein ABZ034_002876 [Listeria monocytogenes]
MKNQRKRYKYSLKNVIQVIRDDGSGKFIVGLLIIAFSFLVVAVATKITIPSDEEISSITQDYIEIQLGHEYELEVWDFDVIHQFGIINVEVSYIGIDSKTGKKKEVMEEMVTLTEMNETIDKEETKKRLEKEIKTAN